jgi:glycosyltransferase involved in cell wall biosynthesis
MNQSDIQPCRVLWLFRNFYPELAGGAERFRRYVPGLQLRGIEVEVLTSSEVGNAAGEDLGFRVIRVPRPPAGLKKIDHQLLRHAMRLIRKSGVQYDAVQMGVVHWADVPFLIWLRLCGVRVILICTIIHQADGKTRSLLRRAFRWLTGVVTHRVCSTVIVSSSCMADSRVEEGAQRRQIEVICNGVDTHRFRPRPAEEKLVLRARLGIPAESQVLLYMGGIVPRKRIHLLIEALHVLSKTHPHVRLYLVGPMLRPTMFHEADQNELGVYQKHLHELAGDALDRQIFFVGESQEPEIWFNVANIFGFCPINEGFGNVIIEAMSSGTPVVMSPFIGLAEELGDAGLHYMLAEPSGSSLAEAMRQLLDDAPRREKIIQQALEWIQQKHRRDLTLDRLAAVYRGLPMAR